MSIINTINPLTRLDYPDPDVITDGLVYYMVSTTMYFMPGCEILRSYDLVHWEHASYVYDTLDGTPAQKLENKENIYGQGMWAASLRHHDGLFYVCFVANDTHKTYIYTSKEIEGPWKKSTLNGFYHDNSILFDDDGKVYIVYGNRSIYIKELKLENGMLSDPEGFSEEQLIIKDTDEAALGYEGAHIYKFHGNYYIFLIHMPEPTFKRTEACFVAKNIKGPYYGTDVMNDDRGYRGSGVAQGGVVQSTSVKWYSILFQDSGSVGRIPILIPITWKETSTKDFYCGIRSNDLSTKEFDSVSFPVFGNCGMIPEEFEIENLKPDHKYMPLVGDDDFTKDNTALSECSDSTSTCTNKCYDSFGFKSCWQFNHEPDLSLVKRNPEEGSFTITSGEAVTNLVQAKNTLTQRALFPGCSASVEIDGSGLKEGDYTGLCVLLSSYGYIAMTKKNGDYYLVMSKREITTGGFWGERHDDEAPEEIETVKLSGPKAELCCGICFDVKKFQEMCDRKKGTSDSMIPLNDDTAIFGYSEGASASFKQLGCPHKLQFKLDHFTGARLGLFMYSTKEAGGSATFSRFEYKTAE